jgi:uncharacterized protein
MHTALITGASAGIGAAFAYELAAQQANLVLVARSEDKLKKLAADLEDQFGTHATIIVQDLTQLGAAAQVYRAIDQQGLEIDLLINNAGIGDYGPFAQRALQRQSDIVKLNVLALVEMTSLFLPPMQQRGSGGIINVGSIAGFQPIPYLATYAASKAFVLRFSEALWAESREHGVKVMALCPGPTTTDFFAQAEMDSNSALMASQSYETAESVAKAGLAALAAGKSHLVTGSLKNQILVNASRMAPREFLAKMLEKRFRP